MHALVSVVFLYCRESRMNWWHEKKVASSFWRSSGSPRKGENASKKYDGCEHSMRNERVAREKENARCWHIAERMQEKVRKRANLRCKKYCYTYSHIYYLTKKNVSISCRQYARFHATKISSPSSSSLLVFSSQTSSSSSLFVRDLVYRCWVRNALLGALNMEKIIIKRIILLLYYYTMYMYICLCVCEREKECVCKERSASVSVSVWVCVFICLFKRLELRYSWIEL